MSRKKVLVIDDNAELLEFVKECLFDLDTSPLITDSALKGIRLAETEIPDLILLDIMMPGMSGDEVAAELKTNSKTADIPVVFLTALASASDMGKAVVGNYRVLPKDLPAAEFQAKLKELLG
jgi:CheY-like chemotaxis protein